MILGLIGIYSYLISGKSDLYHDRMRTCGKCPKLEYDYSFYCGQCNCTLRFKAAKKDESCPLDNWDK